MLKVVQCIHSTVTAIECIHSTACGHGVYIFYTLSKRMIDHILYLHLWNVYMLYLQLDSVFSVAKAFQQVDQDVET